MIVITQELFFLCAYIFLFRSLLLYLFIYLFFAGCIYDETAKETETETVASVVTIVTKMSWIVFKLSRSRLSKKVLELYDSDLCKESVGVVR